ncbi:hypothetical protein IAR55_005811 [Kwoniella newhampshirensis]|uniref:BTB domain-containing protein n=1 Tax=Kwoniella newhampshirensis TaxID=1651941 RepID=A0AAW0YV56_9TREE
MTRAFDDHFPTVEDRVTESIDKWAEDLRSLLVQAKDRFGDVSWDIHPGGEEIWAVVYARASRAFRERYLLSTEASRTTLAEGTSSIQHLSPILDPSSPYTTQATRSSDVSLRTVNWGRAVGEDVQDLQKSQVQGGATELLKPQLEWLYTGEGLGDVVEDVTADDHSVVDGIRPRSLEWRESLLDRREKLGQDLTYMWRSKLYADIRIHLAKQTNEIVKDVKEGSPRSIEPLSTADVFPSHRFILASRSPYFASVLLNPSSFQPHTTDIYLATPPFTSPALHFCLGYIYAGRLDFSNRTLDLLTAFDIYRAAVYLQISSLVDEIESRIVHDFCHGLHWKTCHCQKCTMRVAKVWRFAGSTDVSALALERTARRYLTEGWGVSWTKDVGRASVLLQDKLLADVVCSIQPASVVSAIRSIILVRSRMNDALQTHPRTSRSWVDKLQTLVDKVDHRVSDVLIRDLSRVLKSVDFRSIAQSQSFERHLLEAIVGRIVQHTTVAADCVGSPRTYQSLRSFCTSVDSDPAHDDTFMSIDCLAIMQQAQTAMIHNIRKRWMQIKYEGGFGDLETWCLHEISEIASGIAKGRFELVPSWRRKRNSTHILPFSSPGVPDRKPPLPAQFPQGLKQLHLSSSASNRTIAPTSSARINAKIVHCPAPKILPGIDMGDSSGSKSASDSSARHLPTAARPPHAMSTLEKLVDHASSSSSIQAVRDVKKSSATSCYRATPSTAALRAPGRFVSHAAGVLSESSSVTATALESHMTPSLTMYNQSSKPLTTNPLHEGGRHSTNRCIPHREFDLTKQSSPSKSAVQETPVPQVDTDSPRPVVKDHTFRAETAVSTPWRTSSHRFGAPAIDMRQEIPSHPREDGSSFRRPAPFMDRTLQANYGASRSDRRPNTPELRSKSLHPTDMATILPNADTCTPLGVSLKVGIPCIVSLARKRARFKAEVRYIGCMTGALGPWIGLEVDDLARFGIATLPRGIVDGVQYFRVERAYEAVNNHNALVDRSCSNTSRLGDTAVPQIVPSSIGPRSRFEQRGSRALFVRPAEIVFVFGDK